MRRQAVLQQGHKGVVALACFLGTLQPCGAVFAKITGRKAQNETTSPTGDALRRRSSGYFQRNECGCPRLCRPLHICIGVPVLRALHRQKGAQDRPPEAGSVRRDGRWQGLSEDGKIRPFRTPFRSDCRGRATHGARCSPRSSGFFQVRCGFSWVRSSRGRSTTRWRSSDRYGIRGRGLAMIARDEVGGIGLGHRKRSPTCFILILTLAGLSIAIVNALYGSPLGNAHRVFDHTHCNNHGES